MALVSALVITLQRRMKCSSNISWAFSQIKENSSAVIYHKLKISSIGRLKLYCEDQKYL